MPSDSKIIYSPTTNVEKRISIFLPHVDDGPTQVAHDQSIIPTRYISYFGRSKMAPRQLKWWSAVRLMTNRHTREKRMRANSPHAIRRDDDISNANNIYAQTWRKPSITSLRAGKTHLPITSYNSLKHLKRKRKGNFIFNLCLFDWAVRLDLESCWNEG